MTGWDHDPGEHADPTPDWGLADPHAFPDHPDTGGYDPAGADLPAEHGDLPTEPADHAGLPTGHADQAGLPAEHADQAGLPAEHADFPAEHAEHAGLPADDAGLPADDAGLPADDHAGLPADDRHDPASGPEDLPVEGTDPATWADGPDPDPFPPALDLDVTPAGGGPWTDPDLLGDGAPADWSADPPAALLPDVAAADADPEADWPTLRDSDDPAVRALARHWGG